MKAKQKIAVFLVTLILALTLSACGRGGSGISNGRFEAVNDNVAMWVMQAIIINGNNLTMVYPDIMGGAEVTTRFTYNSNTGVITVTDGAVEVSVMEITTVNKSVDK